MKLWISDVLPADDRIDGAVREELAEQLGDRVFARQRDDVGRRALQHRHVGGVLGHRRDQRHRGRAAADHHHPLARVVGLLGPVLGVDDGALEVLDPLELGRVALVVAVVAAAVDRGRRRRSSRSGRRRAPPSPSSAPPRSTRTPSRPGGRSAPSPRSRSRARCRARIRGSRRRRRSTSPRSRDGSGSRACACRSRSGCRGSGRGPRCRRSPRAPRGSRSSCPGSAPAGGAAAPIPESPAPMMQDVDVLRLAGT